MQETRRPKSSNVSILKRKQGFTDMDDSVVNANPVSESTVMQEMLMAERRATGIRDEIKELKKILVDLCNKEELSEEDRLVLKDTQATVIFKVGELNEITHMLQRTISLCDPSVKNFDKMYQMLRLGLN